MAPRICMREPIREIFHAAELLERATDTHLRGDRNSAEQLFREADLPEVRSWTESLWGKYQDHYHRWVGRANQTESQRPGSYKKTPP